MTTIEMSYYNRMTPSAKAEFLAKTNAARAAFVAACLAAKEEDQDDFEDQTGPYADIDED